MALVMYVNDYDSTSTVGTATWNIWCNQALGGTSATTATSSSTWNQWASVSRDNGYVINTSTDSLGVFYFRQQAVWEQWAGVTIIQRQHPHQSAEEEAALRVVRGQQQAHWQKVAEEEKSLRIAAEARAEKLLLAHLSEPQRIQYTKERKFRLLTKSGTEYEVQKGWAGNVVLIKKGKAVERFCIHPKESVPEQDNMLAQKLLLEANEEEFLRIANKTRLRAA